MDEILLAGEFGTINGEPRAGFARMENYPAVESLTVPTGSRVEWLRSGASPEAEAVAFELSTNGGANYTALGVGTRIAEGWELTGLTLPASG